MSLQEWTTRERLEREVHEGWRRSGEALAEIKKEKLYREAVGGKPQTWEQYVKRVFKITPQHANYLIKLSTEEVKKNLHFAKASHAAELQGLDEDKAEQVKGKAEARAKAENRKPTAADYRAARADKPIPPMPRPDVPPDPTPLCGDEQLRAFDALAPLLRDPVRGGGAVVARLKGKALDLAWSLRLLADSILAMGGHK